MRWLPALCLASFLFAPTPAAFAATTASVGINDLEAGVGDLPIGGVEAERAATVPLPDPGPLLLRVPDLPESPRSPGALAAPGVPKPPSSPGIAVHGSWLAEPLESVRSTGNDAAATAGSGLRDLYELHCGTRDVGPLSDCAGPVLARWCFAGSSADCRLQFPVGWEPDPGRWFAPENCGYENDGILCWGEDDWPKAFSNLGLGPLSGGNGDIGTPEVDDRGFWSDLFALYGIAARAFDLSMSLTIREIGSHEISAAAPDVAGAELSAPSVGQLPDAPEPAAPLDSIAFSFGMTPVSLGFAIVSHDSSPSDLAGEAAALSAAPVQGPTVAATDSSPIPSSREESTQVRSVPAPAKAQGNARPSLVLSAPPEAGFASAFPKEATLAVLLLSLTLLAPAVALYRRIVDGRTLENAQRARILEEIVRDPGVTPGELRRRTGLHYTTCVHHVRVLHAAGRIELLRLGGRMRCFENHKRYGVRETRVLAAARSQTARKMLARVLRSPGVTPAELARALGVSRPGAKRHVDRLVSWCLIEGQREGGHVRLSVRPEAVDAVLAALSPSASAAEPAGASSPQAPPPK